MNTCELNRAAEAVQRFNRFYARHAGTHHERLRRSCFTLTEVRVLHALACGHAHTAAQLARSLHLDTGYLSRLLAGFEQRGLLTRRHNENDGRQHLLTLTQAAHDAIEPIDSGSLEEAISALDALMPSERIQLVRSLADVERLLSPRDACASVRLRPPQPGDFGWIVERHAALDSSGRASADNETYAAHVVARFLGGSNSGQHWQACWIAEQDDCARIGAALVSKASEHDARIELLFVEPGARRRGFGARLITACISFAGKAGFRTLRCSLDSTHRDLRNLIESAGFGCEDAEGANWRCDLHSCDA
jgi:DNA-binding MarR family transcriptional regulator/GNAT superfamily N-acetyltransferase